MEFIIGIITAINFIVIIIALLLFNRVLEISNNSAELLLALINFIGDDCRKDLSLRFKIKNLEDTMSKYN